MRGSLLDGGIRNKNILVRMSSFFESECVSIEFPLENLERMNN